MPARWVMLFALVAAAMRSPGARCDTYTITLDPAARSEPATGRVLLFALTEGSPDWGDAPINGPFFDAPQPIAGVNVRELKPGESVVMDGVTHACPSSVDALDGPIRVQAILDIDQTERAFLDGPGNMFSDAVSTRVSSAREDVIHLTLTNVVAPRETPGDRENLRWVKLRSDSLCAFYGRDVFHRAGVALPNGWSDPANAGRRWPTIFIVPGFGGREEAAAEYAAMLRFVEPELAPQAVFIVLDPESPLGHHGFVDNDNHGPRGRALVHEFIPHLEREFRLDPRPQTRLLYGHSSGGWAVLWLQLQWPDVFGGCWSSAPDPIDFSAFQMTDIYQDGNIFCSARGADATPRNDTPSYRTVDFDGRDIVHMTVRQEAAMEHVIAPDGTSGQQWDAWEAMFSPKDPRTGLPNPMFDPMTGLIDRSVIEHWSKYDIWKLVRDDWDRYRPILESKVRILCGEFDSFYLDRAVRRFKEMVELRSKGEWSGPGYVEIVKYASHGSLVDLTAERVHKEMIAHFAKIVHD